MSETPQGPTQSEAQETLDRAAPIWDRHVVSFTRVLATLRSVLAERDALRAEVGRLEAEGLAIADGQIADRERLEAEVARLRDIISPGDAAAYEEGMAALQARLRGLEAALLDAQHQEAIDIEALDKLEDEREEWRDTARNEMAGRAAAEAALDRVTRNWGWLNLALREWREAESWPDCAACSVLDAALAGALA
jgi:chromosome segregation ATPase